MAEGRARADWQQTAAIIATIAEVNRDPKKRSKPFTAADFDPYTERKQHNNRIDMGKDISALKAFLPPRLKQAKPAQPKRNASPPPQEPTQ